MKKTLAAALLLAFSLGSQAETWRFAIIGDTPYSDRERIELPKMLDAIADYSVEFVVHVGDIKNGQDRCDDALFADRYTLFQSSRVPLVYSLGDNEWTDCHRLSNGAYDPLERLTRLRQLFFSQPRTLGQKNFALERQSATYPEHIRFRLGPVLFVSLNIPGSRNNRGLNEEPSAEYRARNPQVLQWMKEGFALAKREKLAGIAFMFQANPGFSGFAKGLPLPGYGEFLKTLQTETQQFPGQVLVIHGDTHTSRQDHPLNDSQGKVLENFTRVESFGYPVMGWTHAIIDTEAPSLFRFTPNPWTGK